MAGAAAVAAAAAGTDSSEEETIWTWEDVRSNTVDTLLKHRSKDCLIQFGLAPPRIAALSATNKSTLKLKGADALLLTCLHTLTALQRVQCSDWLKGKARGTRGEHYSKINENKWSSTELRTTSLN